MKLLQTEVSIKEFAGQWTTHLALLTDGEIKLDEFFSTDGYKLSSSYIPIDLKYFLSILNCKGSSPNVPGL